MRWLILFIFAGILAGCGPNLKQQSSVLAGSENATGPRAWPDVSETTPIQKSGSNDVALIVAIEDYAFLPGVPGAVKNAEDWRRFFQGSLGIKAVYTLYDQKASQEEILRFADKVAAEVGTDGRIWFVFVGHGAPSLQGEGMLVGMDAQQTVDSLYSRSARQADVVERLKKGRAGDIVLVVDACFSGQDSGGKLLAKGSQPVIPVGIQAVTVGVTVLSAARTNEFAGALPDTERPAFSYLLLGAMRGWADDGDQVIQVAEAMDWTRKQFKHITGRTQTPEFVGNGALALTRNAQESDPGIADMMRGIVPNASKNVERYDTGKGVSLIPPAGWVLEMSIPADYYDESLTNVLTYIDSRSESGYLLYHLRNGASEFAAQVKNTNEGIESGSQGRMIQQHTVEVDGRSGLYQRWHVKLEDGTPRILIAFYVKHSGHLWVSYSSSNLDQESWLLEVNQRIWKTFKFY